MLSFSFLISAFPHFTPLPVPTRFDCILAKIVQGVVGVNDYSDYSNQND